MIKEIQRYSYSRETGLHPDRDGSLSYYGEHVVDKKRALDAQAEEHVQRISRLSELQTARLNWKALATALEVVRTESFREGQESVRQDGCPR